MARPTPTVLEKLGLWPLRVLWLVLPLLTGSGFRQMLDVRSTPVATVAEIGLWAMWFAGLVALLAPSTVGLTVVRFVAPSILASALCGTVALGDWTPGTVGAIAASSVALLVVMLPQTGDPMVNGSSYGPERRLALRPPAALLFGPMQLAWLIMFGATAGGALLIAAEQYLVGIPLLALGLAASWRGARSLHQLSRRWIVFVPAGFVIHDHWSLAESLLIRRQDISSLGPAPLDKGELLDLSGGALGLALLVETKERVPLALRAKRSVETFSAFRMVFTPTLPGQLLHEARIRGISIG
jgi:hypothetical protein